MMADTSVPREIPPSSPDNSDIEDGDKLGDEDQGESMDYEIGSDGTVNKDTSDKGASFTKKGQLEINLMAELEMKVKVTDSKEKAKVSDGDDSEGEVSEKDQRSDDISLQVFIYYL